MFRRHQSLTRRLVPLLAVVALQSSGVTFGSEDTAPEQTLVLYEIFLVEANQPVIATTTDAVVRAAKGDLDGLITDPGSTSTPGSGRYHRQRPNRHSAADSSGDKRDGEQPVYQCNTPPSGQSRSSCGWTDEYQHTCAKTVSTF